MSDHDSRYYEHHALLDLHRHVVIAGMVADDSRALGYRLAALTGLPFTDLDRKIEHRASRSLWELVHHDGEGRYRDLEREHLVHALADRPYGILTVGDGALIDPGNRRRIAKGGLTIALEYDLAGCYWRLQKRPPRQPTGWHPLHPEPLVGIDQVRPFFALRRAGIAAADHRIGMAGRSLHDALKTARAVLETEAGQTGSG